MGMLDWLKEVPLSAVYKERLAITEKQIVSLERENATLKQELSVLKAENETLKQELSALKAENEILKQERVIPTSSLEQQPKDGRTLEQQIIQKDFHNNSLQFDKKTGTWLDKDDDLRFCTTCRIKSINSPLKAMAHGWQCLNNDCNAFYDDPDSPDSGPLFVAKDRGF